MNKLSEKKHHFVHFETVRECDGFVVFLGNTGRRFFVKGRCCSGKGCELACGDVNAQICEDEYRGFTNKKSTRQKGECAICYETKELVNGCGVCNHPFCCDCLDKTAICAYCRAPK